MLPGLPGHEPQRHQRRVGHRIVQVPDDQWQRVHHLVRLDRPDHVPDPDRGGRLRGHVHLGVALALEPGGEGDQVRVVLLGQRRDRGGVDAAGEERAHGHVRAHVLGHRVPQHVGDPGVHRRARSHGRGRPRVPGGEPGEVALGLELTAGADREMGAGLDPADATVHGRRLRHVLQQQVVLQRGLVEITGPAQAQGRGQLQQALLLAGEPDPARPDRDEQRFDAERVARAEQHPLLGVPDQEGEHAAQPGAPRPAPSGGRRRRWPRCRPRWRNSPVLAGQLLAQLQVVVDLAVEHDRVTATSVLQRLVRVGHVDDGQPVEAEHHVVVVPGAALVRSAMALAAQRGGDRSGPRGGPGSGGQQSQQSAHSRQYLRPAQPTRRAAELAYPAGKSGPSSARLYAKSKAPG